MPAKRAKEATREEVNEGILFLTFRAGRTVVVVIFAFVRIKQEL